MTVVNEFDTYCFYELPDILYSQNQRHPKERLNTLRIPTNNFIQHLKQEVTAAISNYQSVERVSLPATVRSRLTDELAILKVKKRTTCKYSVRHINV